MRGAYRGMFDGLPIIFGFAAVGLISVVGGSLYAGAKATGLPEAASKAPDHPLVFGSAATSLVVGVGAGLMSGRADTAVKYGVGTLAVLAGANAISTGISSSCKPKNNPSA